MYYDNDKDKYKGERSIRNLLDSPIDKDYHRPAISNSAFNSNYIQYESMGGEGNDKNLSIRIYLDKIKPYLSDIMNDYKTQGKWEIYSGNKIERKTQRELTINSGN